MPSNQVSLGLKNPKDPKVKGTLANRGGDLSPQFHRGPVRKDMGLDQLGFRGKILIHGGYSYEGNRTL